MDEHIEEKWGKYILFGVGTGAMKCPEGNTVASGIPVGFRNWFYTPNHWLH